MHKNLVSTSWLSDHLSDPDIIVLDASYHPINGQSSPFESLQIKGARLFDIDYFSAQNSKLPHMLAPPAAFQEKVQTLGIHENSHLVIYDNIGVYSAPRAWWMFHAMGHTNVSVLNGGLPKWIDEGCPVEQKKRNQAYPKGNFQAKKCAERVKTMAQVRANITTQNFQIIDARSKGRFDGTSPEPRPNLKSGHMPNAINIPFTHVLENGTFKSSFELEEIFEKTDHNKPMVFTCGSGLTACIVMLAAEQVCANTKAVYDGSWTEWAGEENEMINT